MMNFEWKTLNQDSDKIEHILHSKFIVPIIFISYAK
jgi:hypothetical protein